MKASGPEASAIMALHVTRQHPTPIQHRIHAGWVVGAESRAQDYHVYGLIKVGMCDAMARAYVMA